MSPKKQTFHPKLLAVLVAGISCCAAAETESKTASEPGEGTELQKVIVRGNADKSGSDAMHHKNVSNAYVGKEYLERYRVNAAGDVLKGLNGVYNMNTRTAGGAIAPNIRGISGKGRIPVTLDGTEQTVDVWMNNYGVGERNYLDPALFRSIMVEKSPALTRGVKSGVGGAVAIRTIEAADIIPEGKSWGVQLKAETANNAAAPANDLNRWLGFHDYRLLPGGGATADGAGGGVDPSTGQQTPTGLVFDDYIPPRNKSGRGARFNGDYSGMAAFAFKNSMVDALAAYSYRRKGNYFAGKRGAQGYLKNPIQWDNNCTNSRDCTGSATFIPNMAKIYSPGDEVFNSRTETKTLLLKNNWHLPANQKIGLQYMRSDIAFGEINPFQMTWELDFDEGNPYLKGKPKPQQIQNVDSKIRTDTYKISYGWKPEGSRWIDLAASLWRIRTSSTRHQAGGPSLAVTKEDPIYNSWHWCNRRGMLSPSDEQWAASCQDVYDMYGFDRNTTRDEIIELSRQSFGDNDGKYTVIPGALQKTRVTRTGFDISNRFRFNDRFSLTLSADYQHEKLGETSEIAHSDSLIDITGMVSSMTKLAGPRSGWRTEWGSNIVFDWQPTDRLKISAGVRYHGFRAKDTGLAEGRARRDPRYQAGGENSDYYAGVYIPYWELVGDQERQDLLAATAGSDAAYAAGNPGEGDRIMHEFSAKYNLPPYGSGYRDDQYAAMSPNGRWGQISFIGRLKPDPDEAVYRVRPVFVPFRNGKLDSSVFDAAYRHVDFHAKVQNPQGLSGSYNRYLARIPLSRHNSPACRNAGCADISESQAPMLYLGSLYDHDINGSDPGTVSRNYTDAQRWAQPEELRSHAWAPTIAVSYDLTDKHRLFARYAQMTRFPSIYEVGSMRNDIAHIRRPTAPDFSFKPERSRSWEIGWNFDFSPYWRRLRAGDLRLTYYRNSIKNVLETTDYFRLTQYDRKTTAGVELQARADMGVFFATLGGTYRLKQEMCDRDTTLMFDPYRSRGLPDCIEGGYGTTRGYQALQPRYSVNLDLGTRLLGEKLELGMRGIYHSTPKTAQYDELIGKGLRGVFVSTGKPYHWRSSLTWDLYGRYQLSKQISINLGITNLTDRYYLDPMSNVPTPAPGRTVTFGLQGRF